MTWRDKWKEFKEGGALDAGLDKARTVLRVGSEAAEVLVHMGGGLTPAGGVALSARLLNSVVSLRARTADSKFVEGWRRLELYDYEDILWNALRGTIKDIEHLPGLYEETPATIITYEGVRFGWALWSKDKYNPMPKKCWVETTHDAQDIELLVARVIWTHLGSMSAMLVKGTDADGDDIYTVRKDDIEDVLPSKKGDELHERLEKFRGVTNRSVFVVGEPGTGKSCLLRYVAHKYGGCSLRIKLSEMPRPTQDDDGFGAQDMLNLVRLLKPSVLMIDDLDRLVMGTDEYNSNRETVAAGQMLGPLETLNTLVPVLMASANFSENISEALLRPGRFDEILVIIELDPEIYEQMLPGIPAKILKKLKQKRVPVAYLVELKKRVEVLGWEVAAKEMESLMQRAGYLIQLNDKKLRSRTISRSAWNLRGKSPLQKAVAYDNRARYMERQTAKHDKRAAKARDNTEAYKKKAETERAKDATKKLKKAGAKKKPPQEPETP